MATTTGKQLTEKEIGYEDANLDQQTTNTESASKTEEPSALTNTLASAYHKASTTYNHLMEPVHQINGYVDKKNELDEKYANDPESEDYKKAVEDLQSDYFGDDANRIALANKFEAVQDWQDAHGITAIKESIASAGTKLKDMFAETSFGQKYEEIKQLAASMDTQETETKTAESETEKSDESEMVASASGDTKTKAPKSMTSKFDKSNPEADLGIDSSITASAEMDGPECG